MKQSSLALLGLLGPTLVSGELPERTQEIQPLTLLEKNKREKGNTGASTNPGLDVRVVGGNQVTQESKYPFFVEWADANCGGSLIHDDIAISAAHCENLEHPFNSRVFINGILSEAGVFRTIEKQVAHPLYKIYESKNDYDFLILKLHTSALVDEAGQPTGAAIVELNTDREVPAVDAKMIAAGYGLTTEGGAGMSEVLNDVEVFKVDDKICEEQYGTDGYAPDLMFCAGVTGGGKDTCQGDSGGPILDAATNKLCGVVSYGVGCARASHNGVYARVSSVVEWVEEQICLLSEYPPQGCPTRVGNGAMGTGIGKFSLTNTYDHYASETAIKIVHDATDEIVYFQPFFAENAVKGTTETLTFDNLPAGDYSILIGDDGGDGMCCEFGEGKIVVKDETFNSQVWEVSSFGRFVQGKISIDDSGRLSFNGESDDYQSSWELSAEPANYPQNNDEAWPGPKPAAAKALNVNIKFDQFPEEVSWTLKRLDGAAWVDVESFEGAESGVYNDLLSVQLTDLAAGWYELAITDDGADGVCCTYRRGWVAVTGYLLATRKSGLVWGNNGEFSSGIQIYMEVNRAGLVRQIKNVSPI